MQSDQPNSFWESLQQRVTEQRAPLAGHMRHGRPLTLDEHKLVIGFTNKFSMEYLREPENLVVLRDAAQTLLGRSFDIALEPFLDPTENMMRRVGTAKRAKNQRRLCLRKRYIIHGFSYY